MPIRSLAVAIWLLMAAASAQSDEPIPTEAFSLPGDLEVAIWASAPQFYNPTNIDVDIRGRVWVAEAVNYRSFKDTSEPPLRHQAGDRIVVLEDVDGDARADASHVFVQDRDLVAPLGVAVLGNRIVVSCSPSLIVYTDVNDDARFDPAIDKKEIFLTGFGGLDHDHGLHSLVAGPDGRWYFNAGNAGAHTVTDRSGWTLRAGGWSTGGTPYNTHNVAGRKSDDGRVYVGGLAMTINPDGTGLAVFAHNFRNNYETCVDSLGNVFQNDNDDQVASCRTTWLMQYANAGFSSADGRRSWQADRRPGQDTPHAHWHQDDPGVLPMGDLYGAGSPTGMVVYEDDALGASYRGMLLSCEAGRNAVFGYRVHPSGAGFDLERFSLLSSGLPDDANYKWKVVEQDQRRWFRPADVAVGTDGAIYVADWFDPIVGGHAMHDRAGSGAIYRIAPKGRKLASPAIDLTTPQGQIAALRSPAPNVRFLGFERLKAAGDRSLVPVAALLDDANPYVRARAVWLLSQLGTSGRQAVSKLLSHPDADTRVVALRALRPTQRDAASGNTAEFVAHLPGLVRDASPAVRREVALALRDVPYDQCRSLLVELAKSYDAQDRWYLEAWGTACEDHADAVYEALLKQRHASEPLDWDDPLAALVWRLHPPSAVPSLTTRASSDRLDGSRRRQAIDTLAFIPTQPAAAAMASIAESGPADQRAYANWWIEFRRHNLWQFGSAAAAASATPAPTIDGTTAALERTLLNTAAGLAARQRAAMKLAQTAAGGMRLIALAEQHKLPADITPSMAELLDGNPDPTVRALASHYFPRAAESRVKLPPLAELVQIPGDAGRGRQLVFGRAECVKCHLFGDEGQAIGPDLSSIGLKFDRARLLDAILAPSAAIATGYETWLISMADGRLVSGFILGEGETVLLKDAAGRQHALAASQIEFRKQQTVSLMPEIARLNLTPQDLADIGAFLGDQRRDTSAVARP